MTTTATIDAAVVGVVESMPAATGLPAEAATLELTEGRCSPTKP